MSVPSDRPPQLRSNVRVPTAGVRRFESILDPTFSTSDRPAAAATEPHCFHDLHLDEVVRSVVKGREEYRLDSVFYKGLRDPDAVEYRQQVFADLEDVSLHRLVAEFAGQVRNARMRAAGTKMLTSRYERERWLLDAAETYCHAVTTLHQELTKRPPQSEGLRTFCDFLAEYTESDTFRTLANETQAVLDELGALRYCVQLRGTRVRVIADDGEGDYSAEVEKTFARFRQGAVTDYRVRGQAWAYVNLVELEILERLGQLFPTSFRLLDEYAGRHQGFLDPVIARFEREIQFYLGYLDYVSPLRDAGLQFCAPDLVISAADDVFADDACDLVLAQALVRDEATVVCNDFRLEGAERVLVVSGPNQGGKTTFARMFGQVHFLASLGVPVPARCARLVLADEVFTHFERREDLASLRGKLDDELIRVHEILERATDRSVIVMNESFSSTTLGDARFLGADVLRRIIGQCARTVYVTFVDELASLDPATVSMVAAVDPDDPTARTYRVVRHAADGRAYAASLARKYGLTYTQLREQLVG